MRVRYLPPLARRKIFRRSVLQTQPPSRALVSPDDLEHIGGGRLLLSQSRASSPGAWSPQAGLICRIRMHRARTADVVPGALPSHACDVIA
jgi:hypothetical protein